MAQLGVHFAITAAQVKALRAAEDDDELAELVSEIEEDDDSVHFDTDKGWDGLHRCFSDGTLELGGGEPPLSLVFFGGEPLGEGDDAFVLLVTPKQVKQIAAALAAITPEWIRERYHALPFPDYEEGEKSDDDLRYLVSCFAGLPAFFERAAREKRHVIFTVDQ